MSRLISTKLTRLPSKGEAGSVYFTTDSKQVFLALGDGTLFDVADLLSGNAVRVVGPQGEAGPRGATGVTGTPGPRGEKGTTGARGETGPQGQAGADGLPGVTGKPGADGKDSTVPGPQGPLGLKGPKGDKGDRGDVLYVGPAEIAAAAAELKAQRAMLHARIDQAVQDAGHLPDSMKRLMQLHYQNLKRAL